MSYAGFTDVGQMDELGRQDSPVHRIDARIKALTTIAFVVAVMSFPRYEVSRLAPLFVYPIALMAMGNIPGPYIFKKVLLALPFVLAVGIFNPLLDRNTAWVSGPLAISGGWLSFASILVRFVLTVSAALILVACTGINRLCSGLERMGLPTVFAVQVLLLYRYLFVIAGDGLRMKRSVEVRSTDRKAMHLRTYTSLVGHLLLRSIDRAQRVYQAMVMRGFDGSIRVVHPSRIRLTDIAFLTGWLAFFLLVRLWNITDGLGRWMLGGGS